MARKREEEVKPGLPAWMGTYGDMVTLLLCFFVLLFSMSSVDVRKFKEAIASFNDQVYVLDGGEALTDGDRINNGVSQLSNIEIIIERTLELNKDKDEDDNKDVSDNELSEDEVTQAALDQAKEVAEQVDQYMQVKGIRDEVDMNYSLNYVKITLPGETLFDSGRAVIKPEGFAIIDVLGNMILEREFDGYSIQIEGHTDNVPINTVYFPSNWELSAARAIAVGKYIIEEKNFNETKISCTGYGEFDPIVPNDSFEHKAQNRRVEIKIILQSVEVEIDEYDLDEGAIIKTEDTAARAE